MLAGGPISWKSKKQTSVSLSTMEVEYYMLGIACQESTWLKQIGQELLMSLNKPIHIYSDNSFAKKLSALHISQEPRMEWISSQNLLVILNMTAALNCWAWSRWLRLRRSVKMFLIISWCSLNIYYYPV